MSMASVEKEVRSKVLAGKKFVTKFVDIGSGSGKLGDGVVQAEKSAEFIQAMSEATVFLDKTKMIASSNHKRELDTMSMEIELEAGRISGTPQTLSNSQSATFLNRTFDAEELRALTGIHKTALKENIEGKGFMNTLTQKFGEANGRALERILIYGDKSSTETIASGYKVIDGILATAGADTDVNDDLLFDLTSNDIIGEFRDIIDAFPDKYKEPGNVVFFVPNIVKRALRRELTDNHDKYGNIYEITKDGDLVLEDVVIISVPAFSTPKNTFSAKPIILTTKENIQWLADPDNIEVESQFVLRANSWDIASTVYADINYAFSDAIAIGTVKES